MGAFIPLHPWRPPDPENVSAAKASAGQDGGRTECKRSETGFYNKIEGRRASGPVIIVKPFAGSFSATFLRRRDGSEHRLQIFPDLWAASRCARLLNAALAEGWR